MKKRHSARFAVLGLALALGAAAPASSADEERPREERPRAAEPSPPRADAAPLPVGQHIDLSLRDADLVEVLRSFSKLGGFNLVIDPGVKGKVTVELRDVPWEAALVAILRTHGLAAEVNGRIVSVRPLPAVQRR